LERSIKRSFYRDRDDALTFARDKAGVEHDPLNDFEDGVPVTLRGLE